MAVNRRNIVFFSPDSINGGSISDTAVVRTSEITPLHPQAALLLDELWESSPSIHQILYNADSIETARDRIWDYLGNRERWVLGRTCTIYVLEKALLRSSVRILRSIFGSINEDHAQFSALEMLWKLANHQYDQLHQTIEPGFVSEFIHLFKAIDASTTIYRDAQEEEVDFPKFLDLKGRSAGLKRNQILEQVADDLYSWIKRYPSGLDAEVIKRREANAQRIQEYYGITQEQWDSSKWHLRNVIKTPKPILDLIDVAPEQREAIEKAFTQNLPFGVTPYYLHLMDKDPSLGFDHAVRAQVLPPLNYVDGMLGHEDDREEYFDFMGEHDTSPIDLITRRYPLICILKPYNTCAQICVYCQRNWEIDQCMAPKAMAPSSMIDEAIEWIRQNPGIGDVLVTGGDPLVMSNENIKKILDKIVEIDHVYRIRIGSRIPVVLPQRITSELADLLASYIIPGKREVALMTHFEHSYEITPQAAEAVQRIRRRGIGVYNQLVYTFVNSRRFEVVKLRKDLRAIGVDPYYTFNTKGKDETAFYRVPIARLLQELKEEARLLPGLDRTDEPVFNVPRMGKNHLRAFQDHRLIMIMPDGSRLYEFHPWEKNLEPMPVYFYTDVPIYEYLQRLEAIGEDISQYNQIWYYY